MVVVAEETQSCRVRLVPDPIHGWKLRVEGCEDVLDEIGEGLGPHGRNYLTKRLVKKDEVLDSK